MTACGPVIFYPHVGVYGGIERNIMALAQSASQRGFRATLICFYDRVGLQSTDLQVIELGDHWNPWVKAGRLHRWIGQSTGSILGLPLFFGCKAGFYAALGPSLRYALHYTDPPSLSKESKTRSSVGVHTIRSHVSSRISARGVSNAEQRLTMTKWNARELASIYGCEFDVIYQGGLPPAQAPRLKSCCQGKSLRWFSLCRLADTKHLDWILHAGRRVVDVKEQLGIDDFQITIAGEGPSMEYLKRVTSELGLSAYVSFPGFLSGDEVESYFDECDLSLVPGRQGFGLPVLESLYRRTPVVLSRESRVSEILENTPWARVSDHSREAFTTAAFEFTLRLRNNGMPSEDSLRGLPTEASWGERLGGVCGWWPEGRAI